MSDQQYFISPGGHLRSSQNDLELPSDPIDSGSSNPDVERSSTTMTHRGLQRRQYSDANAHDSGHDLHSEVLSNGEPMTFPSPINQVQRSPMPSSPPPRPARVGAKRRLNSIYVDGPNSTPSEESNTDNHIAQVPQASLDDNDYNDDIASILSEPEDDDDYELPVSDLDSDDSFVEEVKRPHGRNKPSDTGSRSTQRKYRAAAAKNAPERGNASGKATKKRSQTKQKPTASKTSANSTRPKKAKGSAKHEQLEKIEDSPAPVLPLARHTEDIPYPQATQTTTQPKSKGRTTRLAKKPFYDEATGSQRKDNLLAQSSSRKEPKLQARQRQPENSPLETPTNLPTRKVQVAAGKKRSLPDTKQSERKRPKMNDARKLSTNSAAVSKNTTKSERRLNSGSKNADTEENVHMDFETDSASWHLGNGKDPWEMSTTPMSTKPPNDVEQISTKESEIQRPIQSKTEFLHAMQEPSQVTGSKKSPVQYRSRPRNPKRIAQRPVMSKVDKVAVEKVSSPENESDDQQSGLGLPSMALLSNPPDDSGAERPGSLREEVPDTLKSLIETNNGDDFVGGRGFNLSNSANTQFRSPIVVSTDHSSEFAESEDEEHKLPDGVSVDPTPPSPFVAQKSLRPREPVADVIIHPTKGATAQPVHAYNGSRSQTATIQGYSPITSPRNCLESQDLEMKNVSHDHLDHHSKRQLSEPSAPVNHSQKSTYTPTKQSQAPEKEVLEHVRSLQPKPRAGIAQKQARRMNMYLDETETGNSFLSQRHKIDVPKKGDGLLHTDTAAHRFPRHLMVSPSGSPRTTCKKVDFTQPVEKEPECNQLQERKTFRRYDDPFRPSPVEVERMSTRALKSHMKRLSSFNSEDEELQILRRGNHYRLSDRKPFREFDVGPSSPLADSQNATGFFTDIKHPGKVSRYPVNREVQLHPRSMAFASRASQAFQDVDDKLDFGQSTTSERRDESKTSRFPLLQHSNLNNIDHALMPTVDKHNSTVKQPSKWEQAVDAACNGVVDSMHQISIKILEHLRTREENLESVLAEYKRNGIKITARLATRQDTEHLSTAQDVCQVCSETTTFYREASQSVLVIQNDAQVGDHGDGIAQWKKQTKQVEQAIQSARRAIDSL